MMKQLLQLVMNVCSLVKLVLLKHNVALVELDISQEQIVAKIYGRLVDRPANEPQIRRALSGWAPNVNGRF